MLKRPSSRRKGGNEEVNLNLVPMLDALVTLIAFLLFTMSFMSFVSIESPVPVASTNELERNMKEKPLQLTLTLKEKEVEIWSPFRKVPSQTIAHTPEGTPNVLEIHDALLKIKAKFPTETKIIFVPAGATSYDFMISVMDAVRTIEKTDSPIYVKNVKTGVDEPLKTLFPEVIFGNLLGDT
jgi:biopolymer transport protein TolR